MRSLKILTLILMVTMLTSCGKEIKSVWNNSEITIDGKNTEWDNFPLEYDEGLQIIYGVINNDNVMNFVVAFSDVQLARKFNRQGVILWINGQNDDEKVIGIAYKDTSRPRMPGRMGEMPNSGEMPDMNGGPGMGGMQGGFDRNKMNEPVKLSGTFTMAYDDTVSNINIAEMQGWKAAANYDDGLYCFEFEVPLKKNGNNPYIDLKDKEEIQVCLTLNGLSEKEKDAIKKRLSKMRSRMGGGGMGGGMGGPGGGFGGGPGGHGGPGGPGGPGGRSSESDSETKQSSALQDMDDRDIWMTVKPAVLNPKS